MSIRSIIGPRRAWRLVVLIGAVSASAGGCSADDADAPESVETVQQALCVPPYEDNVCSSGFPCCGPQCCNVGQCCVNGSCQPGTSVTQCGSQGSCRNCDDSNPCTTDSCSSGRCGHTAVDAACPGGTCVGTTCCTGCLEGGGCVPLASQSPSRCGSGANACEACDDRNPCTVDRCVNGACDFSVAAPASTVCRPSAGQCDRAETCGGALACPVDAPQPNNTSCNDNNVCTQDDTCQGGVCRPGAALNCNDNKPCTNDSCNATTGCANVRRADNTVCDDGNACTVDDKCAAGECRGVGKSCDDKNPCTTDTCNPTTQQCTPANVPNNTPCTDENVCTTEDKCQNGACVPGPALDCTDSNACTTHSCDPRTGCTTSPNDGGACGDAGGPDGGGAGTSGSGGGGAGGTAGQGGSSGSGGSSNDASADGSAGEVAYYERELQGCSCTLPHSNRSAWPATLSTLLALASLRLRRRVQAK